MIKNILKILYKNKSNDEYIKKSFLLGIFYYKNNLQNYSSEFRLFGIRIWKTKIKSGYKNFYFCGLIYFRQSSRKTLYDAILKELKYKYSNIYINFNCSGETYLFLSYLKPPQDSIFIATKKYHIDLCRMLHPEIECLYLPSVINLRSFDDIYKESYKGKYFYNVLPFNHFIKLENKLYKGEHIHYCKEICKTIGVEYTKTAKLPIISENTKRSAIKKAERIGLNLDKFIFLCPESQSNENPEESFWLNLTETLHNKGFDIFINAMSLEEKYGYGKTCFLNFQEAYYIASLSQQIIGLRSGFIEFLTSIQNIPITCYYTDFKDRGKLKPINADTVMNGFSLKQLPNVNAKNIEETII